MDTTNKHDTNWFADFFSIKYGIGTTTDGE